MGKEKLMGKSELKRPQQLQTLWKGSGVSQRKSDGQQKHPQSKAKCTVNCVAENTDDTIAEMLLHLTCLCRAAAEHGAGSSGTCSPTSSPDHPFPLFFEPLMHLPTWCVIAKYFRCIHLQIHVYIYTISLLFCNIKALFVPYWLLNYVNKK